MWYKIILLMLVAAAPCRADVFFDVGAGSYTKPQNGTWWQDGFANRYDSASAYLRVGAAYREDRLSVRASAFSLGRYHLTAQATPVDANYNAASVTHCNGPCLPLSTFSTSGDVYGFALTGAVAVTKRIVFEAGPTHYRQQFSLHVENHADGFPPVFDYSASSWRNGSMLGVRFEGERFVLGIARYNIGAVYGAARFPAAVDHWSGLAVGFRL